MAPLKNYTTTTQLRTKPKMRKLLFLLISILAFSHLDAQLSITSGNKDVLESRETVADSVKMNVTSSLKTSASTVKQQSALFKLYVLREDITVSLNLTLEQGDVPQYISIERKTADDLSEYRSIKEFSPFEISALAEDGKYLFEDKYPEPRKIDSYYRIIYQYSNNVRKITSGVLLQGQTGLNEGKYGDHEHDESLFIDVRLLRNPTGLDLSVVKEDGKVMMTIGKLTDYLTADHKISLQRRTNKSTSFRPVKEFTSDDVQDLITNGTISFQDKYPASVKETSYYRIVVKLENEFVKQLDEVELKY